MTTHTPGPWQVDGDRGRVASICKGFRHQPVAQAIGQETRAEREANARLIAAAPDMLAAAIPAADQLAQYASFIRESVKADDLEQHPYLPELEDVVTNLHAAIAKASRPVPLSEKGGADGQA